MKLHIPSTYVTVSDDGRTKPVPRKGHSESFEPADNKCLIRASDGKRKISTVVGGACVELMNWLFWFLLPKFQLFLFSGQHQRSHQVSNGELRSLIDQVTVVLSLIMDPNGDCLLPGLLQPAQSSHGRTEEEGQEEQKQENQGHPVSDRLLKETAARLPDQTGPVPSERIRGGR